MAKKKAGGTRKKKEEYTKTDWIDWLWPTFSRYIRLRDCLRTTGRATHGKCVTCGKIKPMKQLQAGHFIPGRTDAILFDPKQVHAQCYRCNMKLQGMWHVYYKFMLSEGYTHDDIQDMIDHANDPIEFTREWFEEAQEYYAAEISDMVVEVV